MVSSVVAIGALPFRSVSAGFQRAPLQALAECHGGKEMLQACIAPGAETSPKHDRPRPPLARPNGRPNVRRRLGFHTFRSFFAKITAISPETYENRKRGWATAAPSTRPAGPLFVSGR
jgi:hypothetical protein